MAKNSNCQAAAFLCTGFLAQYRLEYVKRWCTSLPRFSVHRIGYILAVRES